MKRRTESGGIVFGLGGTLKFSERGLKLDCTAILHVNAG